MRDLVCEERDPRLFAHLGVPHSTAVSWIRRGPRPVVSAAVLSLDHAELQGEVLAVRRRIRFLLAIIRLAFVLVRLSGFRVDSQRVPDGEAKRSILAAIASAQTGDRTCSAGLFCTGLDAGSPGRGTCRP
jgi:hypothetical protein